MGLGAFLRRICFTRTAESDRASQVRCPARLAFCPWAWLDPLWGSSALCSVLAHCKSPGSRGPSHEPPSPQVLDPAWQPWGHLVPGGQSHHCLPFLTPSPTPRPLLDLLLSPQQCLRQPLPGLLNTDAAHTCSLLMVKQNKTERSMPLLRPYQPRAGRGAHASFPTRLVPACPGTARTA